MGAFLIIISNMSTEMVLNTNIVFLVLVTTNVIANPVCDVKEMLVLRIG